MDNANITDDVVAGNSDAPVTGASAPSPARIPDESRAPNTTAIADAVLVQASPAPTPLSMAAVHTVPTTTTAELVVHAIPQETTVAPDTPATAMTTTTATGSDTVVVNVTTVPAARVLGREEGQHPNVHHVDLEAPTPPFVPGHQVALTPEETRAEFLSATLYKSHPEARLGVTLVADADNQIRISALSEHGSVQHSPLRVGDKLLSINGKNCSDMDSGVAGELLRGLAGTITLIAHNEGGSSQMVETMVEKPLPSEPVGIGVQQTEQGTLHVSKVAASGLFAHSLLNVGDRVIAVNQVNCQRMDASTVIQMIRNAPKFVTVLTATQGTAGVVLAAASDRDLMGRHGRFNLNDDMRQYQHHFCHCTWMIILSLLLVGAIILRPF